MSRQRAVERSLALGQPLHAELNAIVLQAYGFTANDDLLEKLLTLNLELAEKEKRGEAVIGPWAPTQ
jgi:hypothetical protein